MAITPFTRPFRFGVQLVNHPAGRRLADVAREIEDLGYATLTCPDHFVGQDLAPIVALTAAAQATTALRIGSLVFDNDFRHPAIVAKEMATLDVLSSGRVQLGLGAGWMDSEYTQLGIPFDAAGVRIDRMIEALDIIERCFAGERFSYAGAHYTITDFTATPTPVQPRIPINIGGGGKRMLSVAAQRADIVGINPSLRAGVIGVDARRNATEAMWHQKLDWVRAAAGARFDELELQIRVYDFIITNDRQGVAEELAVKFDVAPEEALASSNVLVGTLDEICDEMIAARARFGASYWVVSDHSLHEFAPVVERLAGT